MTITLQQIVDRMRELAAEHPDKRTLCSYFTGIDDEEPECIVGTAIYDLAPDIALTHLVGSNISTTFPEVIPEMVQAGAIDRDDHIMNAHLEYWIWRAQAAQDADQTWGEAVASADSDPRPAVVS